MNTRDTSCAERIASAINSRQADLDAIWTRSQSDDSDEQDNAHAELADYGLGISRKTVFRLDTSTGGPGEYLEITCDAGRYGFEVESVVFHYVDWFDHAEEPLEEGSALYRWAEYVVEVQQLSEGSDQ